MSLGVHPFGRVPFGPDPKEARVSIRAHLLALGWAETVVVSGPTCREGDGRPAVFLARAGSGGLVPYSVLVPPTGGEGVA